jgi:hypothetical protein
MNNRNSIRETIWTNHVMYRNWCSSVSYVIIYNRISLLNKLIQVEEQWFEQRMIAFQVGEKSISKQVFVFHGWSDTYAIRDRFKAKTVRNNMRCTSSSLTDTFSSLQRMISSSQWVFNNWYVRMMRSMSSCRILTSVSVY